MKLFVKLVFKKNILIFSCCFFLLLCIYSNSMKIFDEESWYANEALNLKDYQDSKLMAQKPYLELLISNEDKKPIVERSYSEYYSTLDKAEFYFSEHNYSKYNLYMAKQLLIQSFHMRECALEQYNIDYCNIPEYEIEKKLSEKLNLSYEDFSFINNGSIMLVEDYIGILNRASFYYDNYQREVIPLTKSAADSCSIIVQILNNLMPFLCFLIISLICIPMINQERKDGILKIMTSKRNGRIKYISTTFLKYFAQSVAVIVVPIVLCFLLNGFQDRFMYLNSQFPVYKDGIYTFEKIDNYYDEIELTYGYQREVYFGVVQVFPEYVSNVYPQKEIALISYGNALLLLLFSLIVIILFYVSLSLLFHVLFDSGLVAFIVNSGLGIFLIILSPLGLCDSKINQINPFVFRNPVWNLTGLGGYSFMNAIIILLLYSILCYFLSTTIFKKKDLW